MVKVELDVARKAAELLDLIMPEIEPRVAASLRAHHEYLANAPASLDTDELGPEFTHKLQRLFEIDAYLFGNFSGDARFEDLTLPEIPDAEFVRNLHPLGLRQAVTFHDMSEHCAVVADQFIELAREVKRARSGK